MPIGAVVISGDEVIGRAYTGEHALKRHIAHADLLAMVEADKILGFRKRDEPLILAVNLEPCLMCMGTAVTLGVQKIWYGLESPDDGAHELIKLWSPPNELAFFRRPAEIIGGIRRAESQELFGEYAAGDGPHGMREWCRGLAARQ
ncbi:hypothetical protein GCM10011575_46690 [Microlunatus endophyticus]|uniref:CMP/dCMP-type deaminase domain-containing protein n=2 Tax=Microlunatus endophyticus TaxID=1716077 RepID=A0A917W8R2_9ACTN|nr:hypothetical protein GCM10011575_46690 [Microlunatus endophyticus]